MVSHKNHNLSANEGFVILFTSKLITCFIDGFILKRKSLSIAYLLYGSEHIYWILDLENEVHSMVIWTSGLQQCRVKPGSGAEALAFLVLPLPAALTRATLVGVFRETPLRFCILCSFINNMCRLLGYSTRRFGIQSIFSL